MKVSAKGEVNGDQNAMKCQPCKIRGQSIPAQGKKKYKGLEIESQSSVREEHK